MYHKKNFVGNLGPRKYYYMKYYNTKIPDIRYHTKTL